MKYQLFRSFALVIMVALAATSASAQPASRLSSSMVPEKIERVPPPHLEEVPAEIQDLFTGGMTVEEFVGLTGSVPNAFEGLVEDKAVMMVVELKQEPLAAMLAQLKAEGRAITTATQEDHLQALEQTQAMVASQLQAEGTTIVADYQTVYNGFLAEIPISRLNAIRDLPEVKAIHRAPEHVVDLNTSVDLIGASDVWADFGLDGDGITIAIIDTGIDYTHKALGGSGDPNDYSNDDHDMVEPGTFPTDKVVGGYDFAGSDYDASGLSGSDIPSPDIDPIDENGHGTHVASTAAGFSTVNISQGVAPDAKLMSLKVFGESGSSNLVMNALEWAATHYLMHGTPQVINMSLGSNFGTNDPNDPSVKATDLAASLGIVVVASAGNAGNVSYITGSPGAADKAISVAASTTGFVTGPTIDILETVHVTQTDIIYQPSNFDSGGEFVNEVSAPLAYVGNLDGASNDELCEVSGLATGALDGKVALIQRGTCPFADKVNNADALGAVAAIIFNHSEGGNERITMGVGQVGIPAGSIAHQDGLNLIPADGEAAIISAETDVTEIRDKYADADEVAGFSSRGPRGYDSALKPEITAPGVSIFAAAIGSGEGGVSLSGTSMATPHVSGVAALIKQANPGWTPEQVKAAIMNTAVPLSDETTIPLHGAGRINAYRSVSTPVLAVGDEDLVSLSYEVLVSGEDNEEYVKEITLYNTSGDEHTFTVDWTFQANSSNAGVNLVIDPAMVTVPDGGSETVTVTLSIDFTQTIAEFGVLEEYFGLVTFTPTDPLDTLVVPFYLTPKPISVLSEIASSDLHIENAGEDVATIEITQTGPISSSLWVYPAFVWEETRDVGISAEADVRMFGMDYGWEDDAYGDVFATAINTHEPWHVPQPVFAEFDLLLDIDEDGQPDFVDFNFNAGFFSGNLTNEWIVLQVDLDTGAVGLASPFLIYTDYNSAYMEWYLPAALQGMEEGNTTLDFQLVGWDEVNQQADVTAPGRFDYSMPPFEWSSTPDPGPDNREATVMIGIDDFRGYVYSQPLGAMLVDYNGDPHNTNGSQAYFLPVTTGAHTLFMPILQTASSTGN